MAAGELANMGGLPTWIYPDADRRSEGTPKDALVPLQLGVRASRLAPSDVTNDTRPLPRVFDALFPYIKQIPMHSQIAVASGGATGSTINEANVKLVSTISFNAATQLQERKTVAI